MCILFQVYIFKRLFPTTKTLQHHLFLQELAFRNVTKPEAATSPNVVEALPSVPATATNTAHMKVATLALVVSS